MNKSRPVATETVKSLNYTKNILRTIPNNDKMEVVTQTNAVKSPTDSLKATTLVYTVEEIAQMLSISCVLPTTCATALPNFVFFGSAEASASRKTVSMRGSGQLEKGDNVWHILRNAAAPMVSAILTKMSREKLQQMGKFSHERGGNKSQKTNRT